MPGRTDVYVVRDAHRHAWMREAAERSTGAVVVEIGLPLWRPDARTRLRRDTRRQPRVSYEAPPPSSLEASAVPA